ncbi:MULTISPECIES: MFS transporter [Anaeromyxobacter]|uniref:MFS transporter n=1 Tax=Anaeromyxobacter TaxID=161492 RepID=UPI001F59DDFA|nr:MULTISPECIES: MFS transporter [unclassified Anaeromyxobacter]
MRKRITERRLLLLIGAVQFVNVLDFMMVMPLGPDFARALGIPNARLGLVGASYTAAAALSGVLGALILDRFDRRKALGVVLGGLVVGTAAGAFATSLSSMLGARILAGAFGGPATSLSLAIISDVVPAERRGRAMGAVMGAFALASVLGVPAGLELARLGGWRMPFFAVAALGAVLAATAVTLLPPLRRHLGLRPEPGSSTGALLRRPAVALALGATAAVMTAQFALVPNIAAYWQYNLGYPREHLGLLFVAGGAVSFAVMRLSGRLADRFGAAVTAAGGTAVFVAVVLAAFVFPSRAPPALALFVAFMAASSFRMVPMQALASQVPAPQERARFMSAQSVVQHLGSATGALLAAGVLEQLPGGRLAGMDRAAWFAVALAAAAPALLWRLERRVRPRERRTPVPATLAPHAPAAAPSSQASR